MKVITNRIIPILSLAIVTVLLVAIGQNTYRFKIEDVTIPITDTELQAKVITPKKCKEKLGVVVIVQGDGALDATAEGAYKPVWESIVKQGYAVISWDKQGINGSMGNWLNQTMEDRANEVSDVIKWVKEQGIYDENNIGIWGSSQAGWVVPKVAAKENLAFSIMCVPAINWLRQSEYSTIKSLEAQGTTSDEIESALDEFRNNVKLLDEDASYTTYLETCKDDEPMSEDRYNFVKLNYLSDSTEDISNFTTPVLLILGGADKNVDSAETKRVYESILSDDILTVKWIDTAGHSMIKEHYAKSEMLKILAFIITPKRLMSDEYSEAIAQFLQQQKQ